MFQKESAYLHRKDDDFEVALEAMQHLRKQFLTMPFEKFVNLQILRKTLPANHEVWKYLTRLDARLDFGTDSYRYFMLYLRDAQTAQVADKNEWHDVHTDFRGRCEIRNADRALGYAMGFKHLGDDLDIESMGYEADPGSVEETISTEFGEVQIAGYKNAEGHYHGYCQIQQGDGVRQSCFFDDGKILARRMYYANGMREDIRDNDHIAVDPFANRTVYEVFEDADGDFKIKEIAIERHMAEEIFNTLGDYSLEMECMHERRYPYDDEIYYETECDRCVPGLNMALLMDGRLCGVVLKSNEYDILPLDSEKYSLHGGWEMYVVGLDDEFTDGRVKLSLRKKRHTGE